MKCRICHGATSLFLDLGRMPRGNGFLSKEEFAGEMFYPLQTVFCPSCTAVQLVKQPPAEILFHESYPFFTGSSARMKRHFEKLAREIMTRFAPRTSDPLIVEIGSNDGTLLKPFAKAGYRHLGLEPSGGAAAKARAEGVSTLESFFHKETAAEILSTRGPADVLIGTNVFCHIGPIRSAAEGIKKLLKPSGIAVFEDPYLLDMLEKTAYDQIYDEHVFIYSATALKNLFGAFDLELVDVSRIPAHGGSIRYWIAHRGATSISKDVAVMLEMEARRGLSRPDTYTKFSKKVAASSRDLKSLLAKLKKEGRRVTGYAATSKSTTILNYAGIGPDLIEFISDTTESKQGKYSPGVHIPVVPPDRFHASYPDFAVLFAWNHAGEIMEKERGFIQKGGRWILHIPRVSIQS